MEQISEFFKSGGEEVVLDGFHAPSGCGLSAETCDWLNELKDLKTNLTRTFIITLEWLEITGLALSYRAGGYNKV